MKEKYAYDPVKEDTHAIESLIYLAAIALVVFLFMKHSDLERRTFRILVFTAVSMLVCSIGRFIVPMRFRADDSSVSFYRVLRKKIPYSSIKSIDLRTETRSYSKKSGSKHIRYVYTVEIITFHCDNGDHSFAGELIPSHEITKPSGVSEEDIANSSFKRLKAFIEGKMA